VAMSVYSLYSHVDVDLYHLLCSVFVIESDFAVPDELISFVKLVSCPKDEWEKVRLKSKPPKPKLDISVFPLLVDVLQKRLERYPTRLQVNIFKAHHFGEKVNRDTFLPGR